MVYFNTSSDFQAHFPDVDRITINEIDGKKVFEFLSDGKYAEATPKSPEALEEFIAELKDWSEEYDNSKKPNEDKEYDNQKQEGKL